MADQSFGLAIKKNEKYVPALTERMKLKYKKEDYSSVVDLADGIVAIESDNDKALYYKALALMKSESYDEAYTAFDAMLVADPANTTALKNKANISIKNKDYASAVSDYSALIEVENKPTNYYNRALSYMRLENWDEAMTDLTKVIELDASNAEAYYNRSNVYLQLKDNDSACADMRKAGELGYKDAINYILSICG